MLESVTELSLALMMVAGCSSIQLPSTQPDTLTSSSEPVDIQAPSATEIIDEMGDPAPELDKRLVMAQASASIREVFLIGLPGATPVGVTQICAVNLEVNSPPVCFVPNISDGSFHHSLRNARVNDRVALWGNGPGYLPGGVGINEINERVQCWSQRFPWLTEGRFSTYGPTAFQEADDGLFVGASDGLYFIRNTDLSLDPEGIFPEKFTIANGLPDNHIFSITRDHENVWIGTGNGLARMSLATHEVNEIYLSGHVVSRLLSDGDKRVWISSGWELILLTLESNGATFETYRHDPADLESLPLSWQKCLAFDSAGGLWVGAESSLSYAAPGGAPVRFRTFTTADGIPPNYIRTCTAAKGDEGVWIGGENFVSRIIPESGSIRVVTKTFLGSSIRAMASLDDGTVWAGTGYSESNWGFSYFHLEFDGSILASADYLFRTVTWMDGIEALWQSPKGELFIASGVLQRVTFDPASPSPAYTEFVSKRSLPNNSVKGIVPVFSGGLWILTDSYAVSFLDVSKEPEEISQFNFNSVMDGHFYPVRIASSLSGRAWALYGFPSNFSSGFLREFDYVDGVVLASHTLSRADGVPDNIEEILEDGEGGLWLGSSSSGLHRMRMENGYPRFSQVISAASLGWAITSLVHDSQGGFFAGTYFGLAHVRADGGGFTVTHYNSKNSPLPDDLVIDVASNESGGAWIVTRNAAGTDDLSHLEGLTGQFSDSTAWSGLIQGNSLKVFSDGQEGVWVGGEQGLDHLENIGGSFVSRHFSSAEGLPSKRVETMKAFPLGGWIVGTDNGFVVAPYW